MQERRLRRKLEGAETLHGAEWEREAASGITAVGEAARTKRDLFLLDGERGVMCHGMRGETSISATAKEIGACHQLHHEGSK